MIPLKNKATLRLWKQLVLLLLLVWVQLHALNTGSRLPRYIYLILTKEGLSFSQWLPSLTSGNYSLLGSHSLQKVRGKSKNNLDNWASVWVPTPTEVGSSRVFQQIVGFSGEIIAYQELHALRAQCNHSDEGNEKISEKINLWMCRARIVAVIAPQMLSNLIEMAMRSSL